jgi:hypothetical protein
MLNVDAAGDDLGFAAAEAMFNELTDKYKDKNSKEDSVNFKFTWLKHGEIGTAYEPKPQGIQYDTHSCSRFTLDHLFHLSNIDTFALLEAHDPKDELYSKYSFDKRARSFDSERMPREFAFLFRDTQSKTSFNSLSDE